MTYEDRTELRRLLLIYRQEQRTMADERRRTEPADVVDVIRFDQERCVDAADRILADLNEQIGECHQ